MKRFVTALGMCAVLITASQAYALPFTWSAAEDNRWHYTGFHPDPVDNWNNDRHEGSNFPGRFGRTNDTVLIDDCPSATCPVFSSNSGTRTVNTVLIDADTWGVDVSLTVTGGSLTTGTVTVEGRHSEGAARTATLKFTGGAFAPSHFDMVGGSSAAKAAVLDIDANLDLRATLDEFELVVDGTHIDASAFCDIVVADNTEFWVDDFVIATGADVEVRGEISTAATFKYDTLTITGTGTYRIVGPVTVAEYDPEPE